VAALCGIGFTISLFIGTLAFEEASAFSMQEIRLGVIFGSLVSGAIGATLLLCGAKRAVSSSG
jgi:NhaA family Na+:H+ antiporter